MVACVEVVLRRNMCNPSILPYAGMRSMNAGATGDPCQGAVALCGKQIMCNWRAGKWFKRFLISRVAGKREM